MSDYSMTISNSIDCFGGGESTKWDGFNWGEDYWGESINGMIFEFQKVIFESQTLSDSFSLQANYNKTIQESLTLTGETTDEMLYEGEWAYVFPAPSIDAEDRQDNTWSEV